jgi:nitroreductase
MNYDLASIDYILQTTRSVRKRLDLSKPVNVDVVMKCLEIALQAPTGSNAQGWKWLIVTDKDKISKVGNYYKQSYKVYSSSGSPPRRVDPNQQKKVADSASYLADHMEEVPMMIFACVSGRTTDSRLAAGLYGSVIPAAWSLMLALRARGIGTSWTTLHLSYEKECNEILGIPENITTAAMLPIAYFTGETFSKAKRIPAKEVTFWDTWGNKKL